MFFLKKKKLDIQEKPNLIALLYTVGSLRNKLNAQSLLQLITYILDQPNPEVYLKQLVEQLEKVYKLREFSKYMSGRKVGWNFT